MVFSVLICALWPSQATAGEQEPAARLVALLAEIETLRAEVDQLTLDQSGREVQESTARLVMKKPQQFYWETLSPYQEVMVTDGERLWIHEPDLDQVTIQEFSAEVGRTPALLLSEDESTLAQAFEISADEGSGLLRFTLVPREPGSLFEVLSLHFQDGVIAGMQFADSLGQRTSLEFREVELNVPVDPELFHFEVPAGAEVIDSTGGP